MRKLNIVPLRNNKSIPPGKLKAKACRRPPANYLERVATVRLQFSADHFIAFRCFTADYQPVWLLLPAKDGASSSKISNALLGFGLYYPDVASLAFQTKKAAQATASQRGIIVTSNGWLDDGYKQFVYSDRVLSSNPSACGKNVTATKGLIIACPAFDTSRTANLAGRGSLPPDAAAARCPKGTLEDWKMDVAKRALNSSAMMAVIAAAFAAPLLGPMDADPFIILIAGDTTGGKTTALMAAASVIGIGRKTQLPNWKGTDAGLELQVQAEFSDMLFPVDELSHVGSEPQVFEKLDAAAYFFDAGTIKKKHERAAAAIDRRPARSSGTRVIVLTSYEKTLAEIEAAVVCSFRGGVGVRLVEIPMCLGTSGTGIFDRLPKTAGSGDLKTAYANRLAKALRRACAKNHGVVFVAWARKLLGDLDAAKAFVHTRSERFMAKAEFDRSNRAAYRHAEHFGFLYGAGAYAIECGLLPWSRGQLWAAIRTCYRASRASLTGGPEPTASLISDLMRHLGDPKRVVAWPNANEAAHNGPTIDGWKREEGGGIFYRIKATSLRRWFPSTDARTAVEQKLISKKILVVGKNGKHSFQERVPKSNTRLAVYHLFTPAGSS
jgi:hypothetical protein